MSQFNRRTPVVLERVTDIGMILRSDREGLGLTCSEVDFALGTQDQYIQKCEHSGRLGAISTHQRYPIRINEIGFCWLQYLGRSLVMMDAADALNINEILPSNGLHSHRFERVRTYAMAL